MLRDRVSITIRSGKGGRGSDCVIKQTPTKHVPDGGSGGHGGDVIFVADSNVFDLEYYSFNKRFNAENGGNGGKQKKTGQNGVPLILRVPCGTTILNAENGLCVRKLMKHGDQVIVARGGAGGFGNAAKRARREGKDGEEFGLELEYALIADICLLGTPNSGKSALISRISNSKVKVADYPFTTRIPSLGTYTNSDYKDIIFCELPGIVRGSAEGKGVGNRFLQHIMNARFLVYFLDPLTLFATNMSETYKLLKDELCAFDASFAEKESIIVINKIDSFDLRVEAEVVSRLENIFPVFKISAQTGEGMDQLLAFFNNHIHG